MSADASAVALRDRLPVPGPLVPDPKVQSRHLGQQALIYVRQAVARADAIAKHENHGRLGPGRNACNDQ